MPTWSNDIPFYLTLSPAELAIACVYAFVAALHLALYLAHRSSKGNLAYSLLLLAYVLILVAESVRLRTPDQTQRMNFVAMNLLLMAESVFLGLTLHWRLGLRGDLPFMRASLWALGGLCLVATALGYASGRLALSRYLFYVPMGLGLMAYSFVMVRAFIREGAYKSREKLVMLAGFGLSLPCACALVLAYRHPTLTGWPRVSYLGFLPMIACFEYALLSGYVGDVDDVARLRAKSSGARGFAESYGLTEREAEVAELLCEGLEAKEIASRLGIAYNTVRNLKQRVYEKSGAHGVADLAALRGWGGGSE
jgi:DNA-binding CsgD family transcriptional regulator